jgi:hypothetical protein
MGYQGSTLAAIVTDRNTWQTRANSAWGASGVWNSGTSWQSAYGTTLNLYNSEVAAYNDMVAQRDLWTSRANNAWGTSRVWNSGESWEAAYARVFPAGSGATPVTAYATFNGQLHFDANLYQGSLTWVTSGTATYFTCTSTGVTINKAGAYAVRAVLLGGYQFQLELRRNGAAIWGSSLTNADDGLAYAVQPVPNTSEILSLTAGDVLTVWLRSQTGAFGGSPSFFQVTFIPTPSNPS